MIKRFVLLLLRIYQVLLSPLKGRATCRFYPSCSEYARDAVQHLGVLRGSYRATRRILRCHPFHPGGYDPVIPPPAPAPEPRGALKETV